MGGLIVNLTPPFVVLAVPFDDLGTLFVVLTPLIVNLGVLFVNSEAPFDEKMTPFDDLMTLFVVLAGLSVKFSSRRSLRWICALVDQLD